MTTSPHISVISPVYGAAELLKELVERIEKSVSKITDDYEILLIEDAGPDDSWKLIQEICETDSRVIGVQHSRNFGQQYALNCGLDLARGDWIVTLDCDLQDRPEEIVNLYNKAQEGFDIVLASRKNRQDHWLKKWASYLFYRLLSYLTDTYQDPSVANFAIYRSKVVSALRQMNDYYKYYPAMIQWVGFRLTKLEIEHAARKDGIESSYSFRKRVSLAFNTIISFSDKPLRLVVSLGILITALTAVVAAILVVLYFYGDVNVSGWTSVFLSLWFLSGLLITILGTVGIYVGRTFESIKGRPTYIIGETLNFSKE